MEGYNLLTADHPNENKRGGGCMYFKEQIPTLLSDDLCNLPVFSNWNKDGKKVMLLHVSLQITKSEFCRVWNILL